MSDTDLQKAFSERQQKLSDALSEIRRKMEGLMAENQRLREVVRLAESELRKRRDQVQQMEHEIQGLDDKRSDARARMDQVMEQLDTLLEQSESTPS
jgi:chromosome segregation ATPase